MENENTACITGNKFPTTCEIDIQYIMNSLYSNDFNATIWYRLYRIVYTRNTLCHIDYKTGELFHIFGFLCSIIMLCCYADDIIYT